MLSSTLIFRSLRRLQKNFVSTRILSAYYLCFVFWRLRVRLSTRRQMVKQETINQIWYNHLCYNCSRLSFLLHKH